MKFVITGHVPKNPDETMIMLSNHRTRTDWLFLWSLFVFRFNACHIKIALKYPLKYVPGFGWACQMFSFLFLKRNWNEDEGNITALLGSWVTRKYPFQLLYFAEGTDLSKGNLKRSHIYAAKKGLQKYHYVLHPRLTGFLHCYEQLKDNLDAVYDVTIAYPDLLGRGEKELVSGQYPYEVHIHMERYSKKELEDEGDLGEWCNEKWQEKEDRLATFYTKTGYFVDPATTPPQPCHKENHRYELFVATVWWSFWFLTNVSLLISCSWVRWYMLAANVSFAFLSYFFDIHNFEVLAINAQFGGKKKKIE